MAESPIDAAPLQLEKNLRYLSPTRIAEHLMSNYSVEGRLPSLTMGLFGGCNQVVTLGARMPREAVVRQDYSDVSGALNPAEVDMFYFYMNDKWDFGFLQVEKGYIKTSLVERVATGDVQTFLPDIGSKNYYEAATLHIGRVLRGKNNWPARTVPFTRRVVVEKAGLGSKVTVLKKDLIYINEQPSFCRWKYAGDTSDIIPVSIFVQPGTEIVAEKSTLGTYKPIRHSITKVLPAGPDRWDAA